MKKLNELSQQELEEIVKCILEGKTTREKASKELKCDIKTLNDRISKLANTNPELYRRFVIKFPYRPVKYTNFDINDVLLDMIKNDLTRREAAQKYQVSERFITGKIQEADEMLIKFYRLQGIAHKKRVALTELLSLEEITEYEEILLRRGKKTEPSNEREIKEEELEKISRRIEELKKQGLSQKEIEREIGKQYSTIFRYQQKLRRILSEKELIE